MLYPGHYQEHICHRLFVHKGLLNCNAESALKTRDQKDVDKKGSAELCVGYPVVSSEAAQAFVRPKLRTLNW